MMEPINYKNISFNDIKLDSNCNSSSSSSSSSIGSNRSGSGGGGAISRKSFDCSTSNGISEFGGDDGGCGGGCGGDMGNNINISINKRHNSVNSISSNKNINCLYHDLNDLITYCNDCERMICVQCIVSNDHCGHKFTEISKPFASSLLEKFQKQQFPNLLGYRESDKHIISALDYCCNDVERQHIESVKQVKQHFQKLIESIQSIEKDIIEKLQSTVEWNKELQNSIKQQFERDSKKIDSIISKHHSKINGYQIDQIYDFETKQHIEIIKDSDQCTPLLKRRLEILNNNSSSKIKFKNDLLTFNMEIFDEIKEKVLNFTKIENVEYKDLKSTKQHLMLNKKIQPYNIDYYLCHGEPIPLGETSVALDSKYSSKSICIQSNKSIDRLLLCNGFKLSLSEFKIPDSIKTLRIGDIKYSWDANSIPSSVTELHLCDGFNHILSSGMIPNTVTKLYLYDIKQPLTMGSIPSSVNELHMCDGFSLQLAPFVLPNSITSLSIGEIKYSILPEFIPSSVKKIRLYSSFNHPIIPQNISESVETLVLFNIKLNLENKVIPKSIKELHLCDGFEQQIQPFSIENGGKLEKLVLCDIKEKLLKNSIPNSVKKLIFLGYNHQLENGILNDSLELIYFSKSFTHPIDNNLIPNNIEIIKK
ncbi:hypothetical protein DDB_G0272809 [Dictyostelium discoideum AX4]|uniref:B box-type domain-containing protein n=1 Tax=Dictyostelium discoideum TaxID=44689 RepID=Q7KWN1_DICDI|nr:hypothetical protein DDB_G0272809 [Dictyostelium discoideum AX4]EAL71042.1 hypothetical protein DDB_G0272809 [Dictyostelium discoideum AX4]|eukprot:XP_644998.1 hypothetical protein DDB_G0272809 [Dictyostelium discoideum AX4]